MAAALFLAAARFDLDGFENVLELRADWTGASPGAPENISICPTTGGRSPGFEVRRIAAMRLEGSAPDVHKLPDLSAQACRSGFHAMTGAANMPAGRE